MNLYFLRHGIAAEKGSYARDSDRPLTGEGVKETKKAARGIDALDIELDLILSSPFQRARQTAEITAEILNLEDRLKFHDSLAADGDPIKIVRDINRSSVRLDNVMLVGHEPYLSTLMSLLLTGARQEFIALKKGGLAKLEIETLKFGKCAELKWLMTPKQLARQAEKA